MHVFVPLTLEQARATLQKGEQGMTYHHNPSIATGS